MANERAMERRDAPTDLAAEDTEITTARVVDSLVLRGDISALTAEDRARYYVQMCESLGLNPTTQPFALLRLNGKEILYPTKGATDQLAAIHRLTREIIDGPRVIDLEGTKLVYALARVTHPNGRMETATATVPFSDPVNVLMKAETKAKRRGTLSMLGLGMLDESEIADIPAGVKSAATPIHVPGSATPVGSSDVTDAEIEPTALDLLRADLARAATLEDVVKAYEKHRADVLGADGQNTAALEVALRACKERLDAKLGKGFRVKFQHAVDAAEGERAKAKRAAHAKPAPANDATPALALADLPGMYEKCRSRAELADLDAAAAPLVKAASGKDGHKAATTRARDAAFVRLLPMLDAFRAELAAMELPGEAVELWARQRPRLALCSEAERGCAYRALAARAGELGKMKNPEAWLKAQLAAHDARNDDGSDDDGPRGGGAPRPDAAAHASAAGEARETTTTSEGAQGSTLAEDKWRNHLREKGTWREVENSFAFHLRAGDYAVTEDRLRIIAAERMLELRPDASPQNAVNALRVAQKSAKGRAVTRRAA